MERDLRLPCKIFDWLYIGDIKHAKDAANIEVWDNFKANLGFERIINVGDTISYSNQKLDNIDTRNKILCQRKGIEYKAFHMCDFGSTHLIDHDFLKCIEWIKEDKKTLLHCTFGINRSVTCLLYFLIHKKEKTLKEGLEFLSNIRPESRPNNFYINKLLLSEKSCSISFEEILYLYPAYDMKKIRLKLLKRIKISKLDIDVKSFSKYKGFEGPNILINHLRGLVKNIENFSENSKFSDWFKKKETTVIRIEYSDKKLELPFCSSSFNNGILKIVVNPYYPGKEKYTGGDLLNLFENNY